MRYLAIDGGQSGLRAALFEGTELVRMGTAEGFRHHHESGVVQANMVGIERAFSQIDPGERGIDAAAAGLTGLPREGPIAREIAVRLAALSGARWAATTTDDVTAHLGALGGGPGVVIAAGTGVIALGADGKGRLARSGGRGYLLGDAGGGYAIGQAGLRAALAAEDHQEGGSAALLACLRERFGSPEALIARIYQPGEASAIIAAFAEDVSAAARAGDAVSRAIWGDAAGDLARTALGAANALFAVGTPFVLSWAGRIFEARDLLFDRLREELTARWPAIEIVPPLGSALEGARLLAQRGPGDTYREVVWTNR